MKIYGRLRVSFSRTRPPAGPDHRGADMSGRGAQG